jgi:arylsulfatase A-like enzyme
MGFWREGPIAPDFTHVDVLPELTRRALAWIDRSAEQDAPFFLYFPLPAPHTPILPTPEFLGRSGTNAYGDFCLQVDDVVGQILASLDQHGLTDDTIVVFTTDNGCSPRADFEALGRIGHRPSYVFRGHKADIYEGGHRIPLLVRWPDRIRPGSRTDETVCLIDLLATCADVLGVELPDNAGEDSVSNLPM